MLHKILVFILASVVTGVSVADALKVGVSADYPPLVYKQEGRIVGIEADNATAVGGILGREMTLIDMPFERLIPALQAGEVDIVMSGMSVTAARGEKITFTDAYIQVGQMAIMLMANAPKFSHSWSIYRKGIRVGVKPDTTGAEFARGELKEAQISYFSDPSAAFEGLRNDEIDLYVDDAPTSWLLARSDDNEDLLSLYAPLTDESLAWAVRKDDEPLAESLNAALLEMKRNGSLRYILNRWIPVTVEVR